MSCDSQFSVALPRGAVSRSAVCDNQIVVFPDHSDFVTCASCIICAEVCLWDAKFLFQRVTGCNSIADLSLKIVSWTHKFAVGPSDMGNRESQDPFPQNCK